MSTGVLCVRCKLYWTWLKKSIKSHPTSRMDWYYFLPLKQLKLTENQLSFVYTKHSERLRLVYIVVPKKNIIGSTVIKTGTINNIRYTHCFESLRDPSMDIYNFSESLEKKSQWMGRNTFTRKCKTNTVLILWFDVLSYFSGTKLSVHQRKRFFFTLLYIHTYINVYNDGKAFDK